MDFKNKIIVVTGGGQGIGRAICLKFALANGKVMIIERICIFTKGAHMRKTKVSQV